MPTVGVQAESGKRAFEATKVYFKRLLLVVEETLVGHVVHALATVKEIRSLVPRVAQRVDIELVLPLVFHHHDLPVVRCRVSYFGESDARVFQVFLQFLLACVRHLDYDAWVLGEEHLHHVVIVLHDVMQVDVHATVHVGEGHLKERRDETAG